MTAAVAWLRKPLGCGDESNDNDGDGVTSGKVEDDGDGATGDDVDNEVDGATTTTTTMAKARRETKSTMMATK